MILCPGGCGFIPAQCMCRYDPNEIWRVESGDFQEVSPGKSYYVDSEMVAPGGILHHYDFVSRYPKPLVEKIKMDIKSKRELIHIHSDLMSALCLIDELDEDVIDSSISAARHNIVRASQLIMDKVQNKGGTSDDD